MHYHLLHFSYLSELYTTLTLVSQRRGRFALVRPDGTLCDFPQEEEPVSLLGDHAGAVTSVLASSTSPRSLTSERSDVSTVYSSC